MIRFVLAVLAVMTHAPRSALMPTARAITAAAHSRTEAVVLAAVRFHENGWPPRGAPFGATGLMSHAPRSTLRQIARWSRMVLWVRSSHTCTRRMSVEDRLRFYHSGTCSGAAADAFVQEEMRTVRRLLGRRQHSSRRP